jgi:micrococcal nuclease
MVTVLIGELLVVPLLWARMLTTPVIRMSVEPQLSNSTGIAEPSEGKELPTNRLLTRGHARFCVGLTILLLAASTTIPAAAAPTPMPGDRFDSPVPAHVAGLSQVDACAPFNSRIWAQTFFDDDPAGNRALDLDGDGLACEQLPLGIAPARWTDQIPADAVPIELIRVDDGDTIEAMVDGQRERVRLVGIDTHENGGPYQPVECYGPEATDFLTRLLGIGGQLAIERDREDRDQYGRLLRWVWADFGTGEVYLLNEALVRAGYAERFRDTPNRRYIDEILDAEAFARRYDLGLWGACDAGIPHSAAAAPSESPAAAGTHAASASRAGCDAAYPDVCIPPPPPDLQCSDIPYRRFQVLPPDPHHFDGNGDGIACEGPG